MTAPSPPIAPIAPVAETTPPATGEIVPTDLDVLCGKTKQIISHPGTIRYQMVVDSYTQRYIQADTKYAKMQVTKALYEHLKTTSRFLKFNDKENAWEEISALAARDKIGHALRFAVNNVTNTEKKRRKNKRGHRRVGSDFSAASLASIASEVSVQSAATASSGVNSLMNALAASMTITQHQQHQIRPPNAASTSSSAAINNHTAINSNSNGNLSSNGHNKNSNIEDIDGIWSPSDGIWSPSALHPLMEPCPLPSLVNIPDVANSTNQEDDEQFGLEDFSDPLDNLVLSMMQQPIYEFDVDPNEDL
ncbi:expressed unknown protein [Seminavis robusta]|uniref:DUF6824 domain-containing protein n=1 Tax=Seminavis robusta TaxID=568900 RepID=A0A9N8HYT0_9STRA|nr:expressed unknown protein [Seminavis robusta]|eukprot:Sro3033_g342540.1 n/a (306) ;mRNA; r:6506-7645